MYQSQEYLEIGGKLVTCPYSENDFLHGINLHSLFCHLHASGAISVSDFHSIIIDAIKSDKVICDDHAVEEIFHHVMRDLAALGVFPRQTTAH